MRSGVPADPNAVQPEQFTELPEHREGAVPAWPLMPKATRREAGIWAEEWRRPQALQWEQRGLEVEVAIYVRTRVAAEKPGVTTALLAEVRRQRDSLGLTIAGYRAAKFTPQVNPTQGPGRQKATGTAGSTPRWRPEVLEGGG